MVCDLGFLVFLGIMALERHGHSRGGVKKACVPSSSPFGGKVSAEGEGLLRAC